MTTGLATEEDEWSQFTLGDLCSLITDGKHGDSEDQSHSGFYFLSVKDILGNRLVYENARQITEVDFSETNRRTNLQPGDVLFTNTGTIGRIAIAGDDPRTYRTTFQKSVAILKPRRDLIDPRFLYYLLHFDNANLSEFAAGTTQKNLLLKDIRSFEVKVPPLREQHAIAHILGTLDDKIELNRRMNQTLKAMARAIFQDWFVDFGPVRAKMEGSDPYLPPELWDLFPDELVDSELGEIPDGWKVKPLPELMDYMEGPGIRNWQYTNSEEGTRFINIRCIQDGDILVGAANRITDKEANGKYSHFHLEKSDIVVSTSGTLGRSAVVRAAHLPLMLNTSVIRFRPVEGITLFSYLYGYLNSRIFLDELEMAASGSVQKNFGPMHLRQIRMLCPPYTFIKKHEQVAGALLQQVLSKLDENDNLAIQRDTLLPKLVSGEKWLGRG